MCVCNGKTRSKAPLRWCLYLVAINLLRSIGYGCLVIGGLDWGICVGVLADVRVAREPDYSRYPVYR